MVNKIQSRTRGAHAYQFSILNKNDDESRRAAVSHFAQYPRLSFHPCVGPDRILCSL